MTSRSKTRRPSSCHRRSSLTYQVQHRPGMTGWPTSKIEVVVTALPRGGGTANTPQSIRLCAKTTHHRHQHHRHPCPVTPMPLKRPRVTTAVKRVAASTAARPKASLALSSTRRRTRPRQPLRARTRQRRVAPAMAACRRTRALQRLEAAAPLPHHHRSRMVEAATAAPV